MVLFVDLGMGCENFDIDFSFILCFQIVSIPIRMNLEEPSLFYNLGVIMNRNCREKCKKKEKKPTIRHFRVCLIPEKS